MIYAPLDDDGKVDEAGLAAAPHRAVVRRFWSTEPDEKGRLVRSDGHFAFRCNGRPDRMLALAQEPIRLGATLDIVGSDGHRLPFRVASIAGIGQELLPS